MPLKIYYLDDEVDLTEMFADTFAGPGREITVFNDPVLALEAMQQRPPDVLFIDYRLPRITGDQIALQLDPSFPKILITGDMHVECKYPFNAIFGKPYPSAEIEAMLIEYARLDQAA